MVNQISIESNPKITNTVPAGSDNNIPPEICFEGSRNALHTDNWWTRHIGAVEVPERDTSEIAEARSGQLINFFPNTEFIVRRNEMMHPPHDKTDTMLVFVGESWCYGGKIRDMQVGYPSGESVESFRHALTTTVGIKMSEQMNCDLHQSCWPGDQTSNMFMKAEQMIPQHIGKYKKIRVAIQITDSHRDENAYMTYPENNHVRKLVEQGDVGLSVSEWLAEYDRGFLAWADRIRAQYPQQDIEILVWKNFNPWNISKQERSNYKCHTVDACWSHFVADIDGYYLEADQELNNANQLSLDENINIVRCTKNNTDQAWRDRQLMYVDRFYDYINDHSQFRSKNFDGYPTPQGHRLWAIQLCKPGNWFYDFKVTR